MKIVFLDTGYYSDDMANMIEGISIHRNKNTYEDILCLIKYLKEFKFTVDED